MKARIRHNYGSVDPHSMVGEVLNLYRDLDAFLSYNNTAKCVDNCYECCNHYFYINVKEFFAIVNYCLENKPKDYLPSVIESAREQIDYLKKYYPKEYARNSDTFSERRLMGRKSFRDFKDHVYVKNPFLPCIFLNKTSFKCDIYSVRPLICRLYGSSRSSTLKFKQAICNYTEFKKLADIRNFDNERLFLLNMVKDTISRPYPIIDWFGTSLPGVLVDSQKLLASWTQPQ